MLYNQIEFVHAIFKLLNHDDLIKKPSLLLSTDSAGNKKSIEENKANDSVLFLEGSGLTGFAKL